MSLIEQHNRTSNPVNNTQPVEVPRIIQSTPRATTTPATPNPVDARLAQPLSAPRAPGPVATEVLTNSAGQDMIAAAATQARQEVDWQRNQLRNVDVAYRAPLYRSNLGTPWLNALPELQMRQRPSEQSREQNLREYFAKYGEDAPNPFRNALEGNNNTVGRNPDPNRRAVTRTDVRAPGWLQRVVQGSSRALLGGVDYVNSRVRSATGGRVGLERRPSDLVAQYQTNAIEETVAQMAAVGGSVIQLYEMADDAVGAATGAVFDQTLGRALFGSAQVSQERREAGYQETLARRQTGYFGPARDLATEYTEGTEGNNVAQGEFGAYGRGVPGLINMSTDYVQNVIRAGAYSAYRRYNTVEGSLRGESRPHDYAGDFAPLRRALNPLDNSEIYSFFDDPKYSPISVQRIRPDWNDPNAPRTARRQIEDAALMAAGFLLDMRTPEPAVASRIMRATRAFRRGTAATTTVADVTRALPSPPSAARLNPVQRPAELPARPTPRQLPPGPEPFGPGELDAPPRSPEPQPLDLSGGAAATPDYEALFTTPDGVAIELPRDVIRRVEDFERPDRSVLSRDFEAPRPLFEVDEDVLRRADEQRMIEDVDPDGELRATTDFDAEIPDDFEETNRRELEELRRSGEIDDDDIIAQIEDDVQPPRELEGDELSQRPAPTPDEAAQRQWEAERTGEAMRPPEDPWQADILPDPTVRPPDAPEAPRPQAMLPAAETRPVRLLGAAEELVGDAVQRGDLVDTPRGLVEVTDEIRDAQYRLITNRIAARSIEAVDEAARTPSMRRTLSNLETEFQELRRTIAGREMRSIEPRPASVRAVDAELPVVSQQSLTPPANPSTLYQWSRNLPEGQRIYVRDAELVDRSAKELTELARFFGHVDVPRNRVLSGEQLQDLRMQYGRLYSTVGPEIDRSALKRLNVEGVGRVETGRANQVTREPAATKVVSNDVARDPANRTATPQEFGEPTTYSQNQLSRLSDEALADELAGRFSPAAVYADGRPNRDLADTRNDLLQEAAYRAGEDIDDVLEFFPDDIERYAEMNGVDLSTLTREEYLELAKDATADASLRASVNPAEVNRDLPDSMRSPILTSDTQEAVRELVVAEHYLEERMIIVRDEVQLLEELERSTEAPMRALEKATDTNNLLPQPLAQGYNGRTRQEALDAVADRASYEARNIGRTPTELNAELVAPPTELRGTIFYHGTRADVDDIAGLDPYRSGRTRQPLGAGEYFYESPDVAESAAGAFVPVNDVGHLPTSPTGRVTPVSINARNVIDGSMMMNESPTFWKGFRNLIKDAFGDDTKAANNAMAAARKKNLPQFYDYMASRLNKGAAGGVDEVAMFEFQTRMSNFLRSQGVEAIVWNGPDGRIVNVLPGNNGRLPIEAGPSSSVSGPRVIDQATESVNFAQAEVRAFGTESARQASEQSSYRFAMQLRRQLMDRISAAADEVDVAFERLIRADDAVADLSQRDLETAARISEEADRVRYQEVQKRLNEGRSCL